MSPSLHGSSTATPPYSCHGDQPTSHPLDTRHHETISMVNRQSIQERLRRGDPRVAATWAGAAIVLASAIWLHWRIEPGPLIPRVRLPAPDIADASEDLAWFDRRLAIERAAGGSRDPQH